MNATEDERRLSAVAPMAALGKASGRILVAHDQALTRVALRAVFEEDARLAVVGEARDTREMLALCTALEPDLVLIDVQLPELGGLAAARALCRTSPQTRVLILGSGEDPELRHAAAAAGAAGQIPMTATGAELRGALWAVLAGEQPAAPHPAAPPTRTTRPTNGLSAREVDVLRLVTRGRTNGDIAVLLDITHSTVKMHVEHILTKLCVRRRTEAAVRAVELGYVTLDPPAWGLLPRAPGPPLRHVSVPAGVRR